MPALRYHTGFLFRIIQRKPEKSPFQAAAVCAKQKSFLFRLKQVARSKKVSFSIRRDLREGKKFSFQVAAGCGRVKSILFGLRRFGFQ